MSEYNKLYNDFMNLATEVGELETENKSLKCLLATYEKNCDEAYSTISIMVKKEETTTQDLLAYETATWKDRFKYFLTGKML